MKFQFLKTEGVEFFKSCLDELFLQLVRLELKLTDETQLCVPYNLRVFITIKLENTLLTLTYL